MLVLITDGANNGGEIEPRTAARLAAEEQVKIYTIGIGSDPEESGIMGMLGLSPGVDLDEASLIDIAEQTGGRYFRARNSEELQDIEAALDQLEPVAQLPTRARPALALYGWPLAAALLLSLGLVADELWPQGLQQLGKRLRRSSQ
ncbi:von Willebrand factor type A domain protein [compost metagenome]